MKNSLVKKGISGSIYNYLGKVGYSLFNFLILVYVIRLLSVENFGVYNLLKNILTVALIFSGIGLPQTLDRFIPEFRSSEKFEKLKSLFSISVFIRLGLALLFVLIINVFKKQIGEVFNFSETLYSLMPYFSLVILIHIENQLIGDSFLLANLKHKYWNKARVFYCGLKFILFVVVMRRGMGMKWLVFSWAFSEFILFLFYLLHSVRFLSLKKLDFGVFNKRILNFMGLSFLIVIGTMTREITIDNFLISRYLGVAEVGLYSFVFGIPLMLLRLSPGERLKNLFLPIFIEKYTETKNKLTLEKMFTFYNKVVFFLSVPIFAGVAVLAGPVIEIIFDPQYIKVINLFRLGLLFVFFRSFLYPYEVVLKTTEKINVILYGSLSTVYNIAMAVILIPLMGISGAVIASGSAGVLILIFYKFYSGEILKTKYPLRSFFKFSVNTLIMTGFLLFVERYIENIWSLAGSITAGAIIYFAASYVNKGFSENERRIINKAIGREVFLF